MQRAKHAQRRKETRRRLELGEAVEASGAGHLSREEIITILTNYLGVTGDAHNDANNKSPSSTSTQSNVRVLQ
jgi:hypothetical protein